MDTTVYCIVENGDHYDNFYSAITTSEFWGIELSDIGDSSSCKSQRFYASIVEQNPWHNETVYCNKIDLVTVPETLSLSNLYSRRLMNDLLLDSLGNRMYRWYEDQPDSSLVWGHRHPWHTVTHLSEQGPDKEDDFTVYTIYRE
jgi:hypothetical protein